MKLKIGDTYNIGRYEAVPIKKTASGKYWMQMLGMTSGPWPGEGDISDYNNDDIATFVAEFGDAIDHFRLPTKEEMMRVPGIYPALITAAENYGYYWTGQDGSMVWLGTAYNSSHAYYVSSRGIVSYYNQSVKLDIVPAFNLDPSKVILNGKKIMLAPVPERLKEQEPRKGHWLRMSDLSEYEDDRYKCSRCGNVVHYTLKKDLYTFNSWCGRCGSDNGRHINYEVGE